MQRERCDEQFISHCTIVNPHKGAFCRGGENFFKFPKIARVTRGRMGDEIQAATFDTSMAAGRVAQQAGRWAEAGSLFAEAARRWPNTAEPVFGQCIAALQAKDQRAGALLQDLLARFPGHAAGWEELGQWLLEAGKTEAALSCLQRALAVRPSLALLLACGNALRGLGRLPEARATFTEACRMAPNSVRAAFLLGLSAQDARDTPAARAAYERALAIDATLPEAWVNLGTVLQETGDLEGAKRAYGRALRHRGDTFGRISQAMTAAPKGELWLDLGRLRRGLAG